MKCDSTKLLNDILNGKDLNTWTNLEISTNLLLIGIFIFLYFVNYYRNRYRKYCIKIILMMINDEW